MGITTSSQRRGSKAEEVHSEREYSSDWESSLRSTMGIESNLSEPPSTEAAVVVGEAILRRNKSGGFLEVHDLIFAFARFGCLTRGLLF